MMSDLNLASLSDHLAELTSSPDSFSSFYRKLTGLRFPIAVAEILELRSLFNQSIDGTAEISATRDYEHFKEARQAEIDALGIEKKQHYERLMKLLALMREFHFAHSRESRDRENLLRKAISENDKARTQSVRYGKICLGWVAICGAVWLVLPAPGWLIPFLTVGFSYLCLDYFYSLSLLKDDKGMLNQQLETVLSRRIKTLNWKILTRNISLILGYAAISGVHPFVIDKEAEDLDHSYFNLADGAVHAKP